MYTGEEPEKAKKKKKKNKFITIIAKYWSEKSKLGKF